MRHWIDIISDNFLFEMAYSRRKLSEILTSQQYQITQHLLKLYMMPYHTDRRHWRKEIHSFIGNFYHVCLKPNGKKPSSNFYFEHLFSDPIDDAESIQGRFRLIEEDYGAMVIERSDADSAYLLIKNFYEELSQRLSASKSPVFNDIIDRFEQSTRG